MSRNRLFTVSLSALLLFAGSQVAADESQVLKLAHVQPQSHVFHKGSVKFAEVLEEISDGAMEVQIFSDGAMGNERDLLEALQIGSLDVVTVTSALTGTFNSDYRVFSLPFLFDSYQDAFAVMDDPNFTGALDEGLIRKGIRPIAYWIGGARSFYGTVTAEGLADFDGKKVRTMEDPYYVKTWEELGASPTPLPFGEVYTALQTGIVDGAEGAINTYVDKKFYEVASNVAMINYVYSVQLLHISESTWNKLNEQQQDWVMQAAKASAEHERQLVVDQDAELREELLNLGVTVTDPEIAPLRQAVKPVYEDFRDEYGDNAYALVESILNR